MPWRGRRCRWRPEPAVRPGTLLRGARLALHVLNGLWLATLLYLELSPRLSPERLAGWWSRRLLQILGVRLRVIGHPATGGHITVANHVSWLDILLLAACGNTRFIAKSEIRDWPVAGWLAQAMGTFYIRRGKGGARPLLERLRPHLLAGGSVCFFPEGTTTDGCQVLDFHPRLFAAAVETPCPVQPVALHYGPARDGTAIAPFIGEDDLLSHLLRLLRSPGLEATISYCTPIHSQDQTRETLATQARSAIAAVIATAPRASAPDTLPTVSALTV